MKTNPSYLDASIVFFCYTIDEQALEAMIPLYSLNRLKVYFEEGKVFCKKKFEIEPFFFSRDPVKNDELLREMQGDDKFKTYCEDVEVQIEKENKKFWIFAPKEILEYLGTVLIGQHFKEALLYNPISKDNPKLCSIQFSDQNFDRKTRPLVTSLEFNHAD